MSRYVVVLGDATTHDGKVTSTSSSFDIAGKNAALLNDTVSCPEHGMNKIIECDVSAYEENGRRIILHGCKTQCGASVIASYAAIRQ
ncbi:PAAR domain-containing protein [Enterobacter hormaechei]|uniref:PAAR domain-containing protein n=1 Tax=Enterobacter hormaechei TaxID=158836 RepID=UPI001F23EA25|nr:PAAR domain-containing protein [Enterobacter hormaechei]UJC73739.1 PAAR domain-containing protein [Enterobacter hormaechei]